MSSNHPLKTFREEQTPKLSQEALAKRLGVTRLTVVRWENDVRKIDERKLPDVVRETGLAAEVLRPDLAKLMGTGK